MAYETVNGIRIAYELIGEAGAPAIAITPGGRFPMTDPGVRELAEALAAGGRRALIWDRPNCGASDVNFDADNESELHADTLIALVRQLDLGPVALVGGSAGSRVSLIAASRHPEALSHLVFWWVTGGDLSLMLLASVYCGESFVLASQLGMEAVANSNSWKQQIERNPRNRDIILAQEPARFIATMDRWAGFYAPSPDTPVPGMAPADFARLTMPVLMFRNGLSDVSHPRKTTDWVERLLPAGAVVADPPWPDDEWNRRSVARNRGEADGLFVGWPAMAPQVLEFLGR